MCYGTLLPTRVMHNESKRSVSDLTTPRVYGGRAGHLHTTGKHGRWGHISLCLCKVRGLKTQRTLISRLKKKNILTLPN